MEVLIQRRTEVAIRSLGQSEQKHILRALIELQSIDFKELNRHPKVYKLSAGYSKVDLYIYRGSPKLRLIFLAKGDSCIIEDVIHHDRLKRLFHEKGRQ